MRARLLAVGLVALLLAALVPAAEHAGLDALSAATSPSRCRRSPRRRRRRGRRLDTPKPGDVRQRPVDDSDETRDGSRHRRRQQRRDHAGRAAGVDRRRTAPRTAAGRPARATSELRREFLNRLIDSRLQLQEAEREKIVVDEAEIERGARRPHQEDGVKTEEEFEAARARPGRHAGVVKKRLRDEPQGGRRSSAAR